MATTPRTTAKRASSQFNALTRRQQRAYSRAAGGAGDRRSNSARHAAGMVAARSAGS